MMPRPGVPLRPHRTALSLAFSIILLDVMGLTLLFPVGAFLVQRYSQDARHVALLSAVYAAAQFCAAPALGYVSDRLGRRPVILACVFGQAAGYVIFGVGGALWILFLARAIAGVTGGSISTATAYIADLSTPEERPRNFTLVGMAWGVGLVIGPAVGAAAGQVRLELPAYVAAALALASACLCWFFLPESLPPQRRDRSPFRPRALNPLGSVLRTFRRPILVLPLLALCLFNLGFHGANATEVVYLIQRFGAAPWELGALMAGAGVVIALVQGIWVRQLIPRHGERRTALVALSVQCAVAAGTLLAPSLLVAVPIILARNAASAFVFPALGGLVSRLAREDELGQLMGVTTALQSLMSAIGPAAAGEAHERLFSGAGYALGAALVGLAAIVAARLRPPPRRAG